MNRLLKEKNKNRLEVPEQHKYVGPSPQEVLGKLTNKKVNKSKNTNYCSAELLYNDVKAANGGILQKASMGFNLSRDKQNTLINYFKDHSDLEIYNGDTGAGDYRFAPVTNRSFAKRRVIPTSVKGTKYLLSQYKSLGLTLTINGTTTNFTECTFDFDEEDLN